MAEAHARLGMSRWWSTDNVAPWRAGTSRRLTTQTYVGKPRRDHGPGRACSEPECLTVLNRYHPGDRCYAHEAA